MDDLRTLQLRFADERRLEADDGKFCADDILNVNIRRARPGDGIGQIVECTLQFLFIWGGNDVFVHRFAGPAAQRFLCLLYTSACAIRDCCREKGLRYCLECTAFPCRRLNRLEKSYRTRYDASLLSNSRAVLTLSLIHICAILAPMKQVSQSVTQSKAELMRYRKAPQFAPAGQSTQMIIGASPETDYQILRLTEGLYQKYSLKRVFFSAYIPAVSYTHLDPCKHI